MTTQELLPPATAFPAGEYLRDEIEARGWTISEFAEIMGRPVQAISEILNGHKQITPATASEIAHATGTDAATWLNLQSIYDLWLLRQTDDPTRLDEVSRRARLATLVPINELKKRKIIPDSRDLDVIEPAVMKFLGVASLDEPPLFSIAARRSNAGDVFSAAQNAWLACARNMAAGLKTKPYSRDGLEELASRIREEVASPEDLASLPAKFSEVGVKLVHVSPFKGSKIDGAAWQLPSGPTIALSARISRFDSVLFTLLHEVAHIVLGHAENGPTVDSDFEADSENETAANQRANDWLLPGLVSIPEPLSAANVSAAARAGGVHPAIVVGKLQHTGRLPWTHLRKLVPDARVFVETWPSGP